MNLETVKKFTANVAVLRGWVLNTDEQFTETIQKGLLANFQKFGYYQCPCRTSWDKREKDKDIICPCDYAAKDVEEFGHCFCGLYLSEEFSDTGAEPETIPERRPDELYP